MSVYLMVRTNNSDLNPDLIFERTGGDSCLMTRAIKDESDLPSTIGWIHERSYGPVFQQFCDVANVVKRYVKCDMFDMSRVSKYFRSIIFCHICSMTIPDGRRLYDLDRFFDSINVAYGQND